MTAKNILVLSSIYPAEDLPKQDTPVVHYFAREWVKMGHNVIVMHYPSNFPTLLNIVLSFFSKQISTKKGFMIRTYKVKECEYNLEGVKVKRIPLKKIYPHKKHNNSEINSAFQQTCNYLGQCGFVPDVITSHWATPQLELISLLKKQYNVPVCYVTHSSGLDISRAYNKEEANKLLSQIDVLGFRSEPIKDSFLKQFAFSGKTFFCFSGIPENFLKEPLIERTFDKVDKFIFIGNFIQRKYPAEIIPAIKNAYNGESFTMLYVGTGPEEKNIQLNIKKYDLASNVKLLGRLKREDVIKELQKSDIFIMISKNEAYGLVYLEAMSMGCIVIASRNEGFDGVIKDGVNGFLCEAGNVDELSRLLNSIRKMPKEELRKISLNAIQTARNLTDVNVAEFYLNSIIPSCKNE